MQVEVPGRLIREEDRGRGEQRAGDGHALLLTARELRGLLVTVIAEAHELDDVLERRAVGDGGPARRSRAGRAMFSATVSTGTRLKNWYTIPIRLRRSRVRASSLSDDSGVPSQLDLARVGRVEAAQQVEQGRLARPRRTHDRREPSRLDLEGQVVEDALDAFALRVVLHDLPSRQDHPTLLPNHRCPP